MEFGDMETWARKSKWSSWIAVVTIWMLGENRVRGFYGTEKREEKDLRYIQKASSPAAGLCIRPVTSCTSVTAVE
jgi:hypothetical protein